MLCVVVNVVTRCFFAQNEHDDMERNARLAVEDELRDTKVMVQAMAENVSVYAWTFYTLCGYLEQHRL